MRTILLTFDIEEADILEEYNLTSNSEEHFNISKNGFIRLIDILQENNVNATFFVTASFAKKYPFLIKKLANQGHEIACHGYHHSDNYYNEKIFEKIKIAKEEIEKIINKPLKSFRAPRLQIKNIHKLNDFDFKNDSSTHPTWIPGRYFYISKPNKIYKIGNINEIPISALPFFRTPIAWIAFRNFGLNYAKIFTKIKFLFSRKQNKYTMLLFHPWEFADIHIFNLPGYIKKNTGLKLVNMLDNYIKFCKKNKYNFDTIDNYLNSERK